MASLLVVGLLGWHQSFGTARQGNREDRYLDWNLTVSIAHYYCLLFREKMTISFLKVTFVAIAAPLAIAATLATAQSARAQATITCASQDYQRSNCPIDTSNGVKLVKQLSKRSCNGNWGYGTGFVWVDEGCRAQFQAIEPPNYSQPATGTPQNDQAAQPETGAGGAIVERKITCASEDYQRQTCPLETSQGIVMLRQLSKTSCADNWGYGDGFVWVQNGCRAEFGALQGAPVDQTASGGPPSLGQPSLARIQRNTSLWSQPGNSERVANLSPGEAIFVYWNTRRNAAGNEYVYIKTATGEREGWTRVGEGW